jgi:hypothetical protein
MPSPFGQIITASRTHRERVDCGMPSSFDREVALRAGGTVIFFTRLFLNSAE